MDWKGRSLCRSLCRDRRRIPTSRCSRGARQLPIYSSAAVGERCSAAELYPGRRYQEDGAVDGGLIQAVATNPARCLRVSASRNMPQILTSAAIPQSQADRPGSKGSLPGNRMPCRPLPYAGKPKQRLYSSRDSISAATSFSKVPSTAIYQPGTTMTVISYPTKLPVQSPARRG